MRLGCRIGATVLIIVKAIDHEEINELLAPFARAAEVLLAGNGREIDLRQRDGIRHGMNLHGLEFLRIGEARAGTEKGLYRSFGLCARAEN